MKIDREIACSPESGGQRYLKGWCENCNDMVTGKTIDIGIGAYEFWGTWHEDKIIVVVCEDCNGELEDVEEVGQPIL